MAVTKCKECGGKVSTKADACPSCGAKISKKTSVVTWLVALTVAVVTVNAIISDDPAPKPKPEKTAEQKAADAESSKAYAYVMAFEKVIKAGLKDPDSAKFKGSFYKEPYVCGYVNAKNSFGAFTGDKEFVANTLNGSAQVNDGSSAFASVWNDNCT